MKLVFPLRRTASRIKNEWTGLSQHRNGFLRRILLLIGCHTHQSTRSPSPGHVANIVKKHVPHHSHRVTIVIFPPSFASNAVLQSLLSALCGILRCGRSCLTPFVNNVQHNFFTYTDVRLWETAHTSLRYCAFFSPTYAAEPLQRCRLPACSRIAWPTPHT